MCKTEMLDALINAGVDVNAKTSERYTPPHYALLQNSGLSGMHWRSEESRIRDYETRRKLNAARLLIDAGVDVHAKANTGETSPHIAAKRGMDETAVALIVSDADVNAKNNFDEPHCTALFTTAAPTWQRFSSPPARTSMPPIRTARRPASVAATGWNYDYIAKLLQADVDMLGSKAWGASQRPVDMDCGGGRAGRSPPADARGRRQGRGGVLALVG